MNSAVVNEVVGALKRCIERSDREWMADECDAWIYGILIGFSISEMEAIRLLHGWDNIKTQELMRLHMELFTSGTNARARNAIVSMANRVAREQWNRSFDDEMDAIIYGILCGWRAPQMDLLSFSFGWQDDTVQYINRLHRIVSDIMQTSATEYMQLIARRARHRLRRSQAYVYEMQEDDAVLSRLIEQDIEDDEVEVFTAGMTREDYTYALQEHRAAIDMLKERYRELLAQCPHDIVRRGSMGAKCSICEQDFGWYCPASPDHTCYYFTQNDIDGHYIVLKNRDIHRITGHDPRWETRDSCLFCHNPEERK